MVSKRLIWSGLILISLSIITVSCSREVESPLPKNMQGLQLKNLVEGESAEAMINRLHNKRVTSKDSYIGHYAGDGLRATLYFSRFNTEDEASELLESMIEGMKRSGGAFGHFRRFTENDKPVYSVFGLGQIHYFYQTGRSLIWLAADPPVAQEVFMDVFKLKWE